MIEGLKVTMPGARLRELLAKRIQWHGSRVAYLKRQLKRGAGDERTEIFTAPDHILEHERDAHEDRAGLLALIREQVVAKEIYRLNEADLRFGDLWPEPDRSVKTCARCEVLGATCLPAGALAKAAARLARRSLGRRRVRAGARRTLSGQSC